MTAQNLLNETEVKPRSIRHSLKFVVEEKLRKIRKQNSYLALRLAQKLFD